MTTYTLLVHNTSPARIAVAIAPELGDVAQIAWRTGVIEPFVTLPFRWTLRYTVFAARTGPLHAGAIVRPVASADADPAERNLVPLTYGTSFRFGPAERHAEEGVLIIRQDESIPLRRGAVGVAIDGRPAGAVQAQPNIDARFLLHPAWWVITSDHFDEGQLLEEKRIAAVHRVIFAPGTTEARVEV